MSHIKIINKSQVFIHKYETPKSEKNIFEILLAPLKHAVILRSFIQPNSSWYNAW